MANLIEALEYNAILQPDKPAYIFISDSHKENQSLTYEQLVTKAKAIATTLQAQFKPGTKAILIYTASRDFLPVFFGCLFAQIIAIPTPAPDNFTLKRTLPRIKSIVEDAQPDIILTTADFLPQVEKLLDKKDSDLSKNIKKIITDDIPLALAEKYINSHSFEQRIAYLQYTSGSTSSPKGVIITHQNLIHNFNLINQAFEYTQNSITATWVPYFHDMGLVEGLLHPIFRGMSCYVISPFMFIKKPLSWIKTISDYRVTHTSAPNFAYDYCCQYIKDQEFTNIDLSSWEIAFVGAEPVKKETIDKFTQQFKPYGFNPQVFCPCYGLAEATLKVTATKKSDLSTFITVDKKQLAQNRIVECAENQGITLTGCGTYTDDTKVVIVNPQTLNLCQPDEVGEIWVSNASVSPGYWNREEETKKTFQAYLNHTNQVPFLRTGDFGFIKDGQLFVTGRLKDMMIIRGENYYPQDLEISVEKAHPSIRSNCSAIFSIEINDLEQIVIVAEVQRINDQKAKEEEIFQAIRTAIKETYELPIYAVVLIKKGSIPKTSSGKIQRHACKTSFLDGSLESVAIWTQNQAIEFKGGRARNPWELQLVQIWQQVLKISPIGRQDNFFDIGGDSLKAAQVLLEVEKVYGQNMPLVTLLEAPTIEKLAQVLQKADWQPNWRSLVPLKPSGSKKPFFYVHPLGGNVIMFAGLARHFDSQRPLYALQSVGLDCQQPPFKTIEEMATHYIQEIKTIQPLGPYLLGGRCMGGKIAFEMAQQLIASGDSVSIVVMVENGNPNIYLNVVNDQSQDHSLFEQVIQTNSIANNCYIPKFYPSSIALFIAEDDQHNFSDKLAWHKFCRDGADIYTIPGTHQTLDFEPHVQVLAQKLAHCLDYAEEPISNSNTRDSFEQEIISEVELAGYQEIMQLAVQAFNFYQQNQKKLAIEIFEKLVKLYPDYDHAYTLLAQLHKQQANFDQAIINYQKSIDLNPNQHYSIYQNLANLLQQQGDKQAAIVVIKQALELYPSEANVYKTFGYIYLNQGLLDLAVNCYQKAIELNPNQFEYYQALGGIFNQKGQKQEAINYLLNAQKLNPNSDFICRSLGIIYQELGQLTAAIIQYQKAIEINPNQPEIIYKNLAVCQEKINL